MHAAPTAQAFPSQASGPQINPILSPRDLDTSKVTLKIEESQIKQLPAVDDEQRAVVQPDQVKRYRYSSTTACPGAHPDRPETNTLPCMSAMLACQPPGPPGPLTWIWRQTTQANRVTQPWTIIASTCARDAAPAARPTLTLALLRQAFHDTPWATLSSSIQPPGGRTLITLPIYVQAQWSTTGYEPGEIEPINPARMLGYRVDIRPVLVGYTYHFGDGTTVGPTTNPGGAYPDGTITHTYTQAGRYPSHITATVGAQFRISGGAWVTIPDTVTLTGALSQVEVLTAKAVLVR